MDPNENNSIKQSDLLHRGFYACETNATVRRGTVRASFSSDLASGYRLFFFVFRDMHLAMFSFLLRCAVKMLRQVGFGMTYLRGWMKLGISMGGIPPTIPLVVYLTVQIRT